jgi:hypothetical protein
MNTCHEKDFGLSAEWHFFATSNGKGPAYGIGGTVKKLAQIQVYRKCIIIKFMNYLITATATYTPLYSFMSKKNKFLTIRRNLKIDLKSQLQ